MIPVLRLPNVIFHDFEVLLNKDNIISVVSDLTIFGRLWLKQMEGNRRAKQKPTATRHSSTKDVSMCGRMVTMMSLKSRPEMEPLWPQSRWMKARRACSSCISCGRGAGGG